MRKTLLIALFNFFVTTVSFAQTNTDTLRKTDSIHTIDEVTVVGYISSQPYLRTAASVGVINNYQMRLQPGTSLVPVFNTVPGVRMEERSPASYRLSLRGSLLRSPFGIRNVKVYMNEYPLTDAGGNTYLNALSLNSIERVEILKGPDGSLFGANSGGVVLLQADKKDSAKHAEANLGTGSYGLFNQQLSLAGGAGKHVVNFKEAYQRSDGYRENSAMHRLYLQLSDSWQYSATNQLEALVFYSDLAYQTPGGLTLAQYIDNVKSARYATATLPGAVEQKAAVYNKILFGGITHKARLSKSWSHVLAVFGNTVSFKNPFITNYEVRDEKTLGARSYLAWNNDITNNLNLEYNLGAEWQQTVSKIHNYDNNQGKTGALQAYSNILSDQHFFFTRLKADIKQRLVVEAAVSVNSYSYSFRDTAGVKKNFDPQWMPRVALSYKAATFVVLRATISRGYSAPTTAEVRPSDNQIYQNLQPENGWNYEAGLRVNADRGRFTMDMSAFKYRLQNAIVRQLNNNGTEYFINAGGTKQTGLESQVSYRIVTKETGSAWIKGLQLNNASTLSFFKFNNYNSAGKDYSGNRLTGVPRQVVVSSFILNLPAAVYLFAQHNYTARLPLNDANTTFANAYNLVQLKAGWQPQLHLQQSLEIYAGIDNLLNEKYSLGNDLNAAGNRYYNAAPARNFFAGIIYRY